MIHLAHASHWLAQVAYVAPVVVLLVALGITTLRDRRRERRGEGPPSAGPPASSAELPPA
ncbi:MAG: hypothetical protein M3469_00150 [Actinomycetota bacterium]|nr:hypothetical protein [Actinomycetota bacterium]